jgi:hypothetical protein
MIEALKAGLAKLTPEERTKLGKAIGPDADALLEKAFGSEITAIFSKPRKERLAKSKKGGKTQAPKSLVDSLTMGGRMAQPAPRGGQMSRALMEGL